MNDERFHNYAITTAALIMWFAISSCGEDFSVNQPKANSTRVETRVEVLTWRDFNDPLEIVAREPTPTHMPGDQREDFRELVDEYRRERRRSQEAQSWIDKGITPSKQHQDELNALQSNGWEIKKVDSVSRELGSDDVYDVSYTVTVTLERTVRD